MPASVGDCLHRVLESGLVTRAWIDAHTGKNVAGQSAARTVPQLHTNHLRRRLGMPDHVPDQPHGALRRMPDPCTATPAPSPQERLHLVAQLGVLDPSNVTRDRA